MTHFKLIAGKVLEEDFHSRKLLLQLQQIFPELLSLQVQSFYLVNCQAELTELENEQLNTLLQANSAASSHPKHALAIWVTPRLGTISPWSSKATDIAWRAGLDFIKRIERATCFYLQFKHRPQQLKQDQFAHSLYDPLTESLLFHQDQLADAFIEQRSKPFTFVNITDGGIATLNKANRDFGLALSDDEVTYLYNFYSEAERDPSLTELMMFAQINSEHCRHKIFNAKWIIDQQEKPHSLFAMIKFTAQQSPQQLISAYHDNAAVVKSYQTHKFKVNPESLRYETIDQATALVFKAETHNHPTAIAPDPGAATGSGGEIRDEAATGRGAETQMGFVGFAVNHLQLPALPQPWEQNIPLPKHVASSLQIMLQAPIGAASYNNEFGRPCLAGFFRTCTMQLDTQFGDLLRGFSKPIMLAGGLGQIDEAQTEKEQLHPGDLIVVLGGPAMLIGLGGGAASSRSTHQDNQTLDFASVQRANPELERRCQEVINQCVALKRNPILSIHDVGAGGLSNAIPELVAACDMGAHIELRDILNADSAMSPTEIWCNEAQERFVLSIAKDDLEIFKKIADREQAPYAIVGEVKGNNELVVHDRQFANDPVRLPMPMLFEHTPRLTISCQHKAIEHQELDLSAINIDDAIKRVLQFPAVADKSFLITIGDRSVTGLVARDQMIGPWQVPVADVAVTLSNYTGYDGAAIAMGERSPIALLHHAASARMAIGETITNIAAAPIQDIGHIILSCNWMAAINFPGEEAGLYDAVEGAALELCPALGISVPVGKDSLSMQTNWRDAEGKPQRMAAPLSLIVSATAPVQDARKTLTPLLRTDQETVLILLDLGQRCNFLGGSVLAQCYNELGDTPPDIDNPALLKSFFNLIQTLNHKDLLLAYHDRSDGGLLVTLVEMMFASHVGVTCKVDELGDAPLAALFTEELGAVIQVAKNNLEQVWSQIKLAGLRNVVHVIGEVNDSDELVIHYQQQVYYRESRVKLQQLWSRTSYEMQKLRDHPDCAEQAYAQIADVEHRGLYAQTNFKWPHKKMATQTIKPKIAILREEGVNGHKEMAAAFTQAGFEAFDVHMSDLLAGRMMLTDFQMLAAAGGFSFGDVLGSGWGWAQSILMHAELRDQFAAFFADNNKIALGVCNGCQMLSHLQSLIPGSDHWPKFRRNQSQQFEARLAQVMIRDSKSLLLREMADSALPIVVSHGEGYCEFTHHKALDQLQRKQQIVMNYIDSAGQPTMAYPDNPNGSPQGVTGFCNEDGRITIMMPHPERVFRAVQMSWHPIEWRGMSPWFKLFTNAARLFL